MSDQIPHGPKDLVCPFHKKYMNKVCHTCPMWVKIVGKNPQTTEIIDKWNCSLAWLPMLTIENTQMTRATGVAVESLRNEIAARVAPNPNAGRTKLPTGDEFETKYLSPNNINKARLIENK